jgi:hypothetical protein
MLAAHWRARCVVSKLDKSTSAPAQHAGGWTPSGIGPISACVHITPGVCASVQRPSDKKLAATYCGNDIWLTLNIGSQQWATLLENHSAMPQPCLGLRFGSAAALSFCGVVYVPSM